MEPDHHPSNLAGVGLGARIIGGFCLTTPEHIRLLRDRLAV